MSGELTGRKVFFIVSGGFAIVIAANMAMLYASLHSFPGLVVENSYVASQSFNERVAEIRALGWESEAYYQDGVVSVELVDHAGQPVETTVHAEIGRPTLAAGVIELSYDPVVGRYVAEHDLAPGRWRLDLFADAADGGEYEAHYDLFVRDNE
jgi:nitrogen fixation protein FixH